MTVTIYAMTHKHFEQPKDKMYVPLQVGHACREDLGYLGDDTGDNISDLNCYYAELSGIYWLYRNERTSDYIGICHYRRYLLNERGKLFKAAEIEDLLGNGRYDILTTKKVILDHSYYEAFSGKHNIEDLKATEQVITEIYPEYLSTYQNLVHQNKTYFGNMMITSRQYFQEYAKWLFDIFFVLQERIDPSQYDDYRKRVYGFISEFLLYVWVTYRHLKVLECDVAVIGEKKETSETKERLADFFLNKDVKGAKEYFFKVYTKRPDVLMEASDFDGTLKLAMQAIATAEREEEAYGTSTFTKYAEFDATVNYYRKLNQVLSKIKNKEYDTNDISILENLNPSSVALDIALLLICSKQQLPNVKSQLKKLYQVPDR